MTTLIANIGTSDLSIKVGDYFIPVGFDRSEPNIDSSDLTIEEKSAWDNRSQLIGQHLCTELGVETKMNDRSEYQFSFRAITSALASAYMQDSTWHSRIRPGRIWGVIKEAHQTFGVNRVCVFVTDQTSADKPGGHPSDSVYLIDILERWLRSELPDVTLVIEKIPADISIIQQDEMLNYYYSYLNNIDMGETVLVSIKGGTPQMQTALQIQAISSATQRLLFLDPHLSIKRVLAGEASDCKHVSYWQYRRGQKHQTIQKLLSRWDFDGAQRLVNDWQEDLYWLTRHDSSIAVAPLKLLLDVLSTTCLCLNLDSNTAKKYIDKNQLLKQNVNFKKLSDGRHDLLQDLYAQCKIKWELGQIPDFLWRMSSFQEETLNRLILEWCDKLGKSDIVDKRDNGYFLKLTNLPIELKGIFVELEDKPNLITNDYRLESRDTKRNLLEALIRYDKSTSNKLPAPNWDVLGTVLGQLDYWAGVRNQIIHNAKGVSIEQMSKMLAKDRASIDKQNSYKKQMINVACEPCNILKVMAEIYSASANLLRSTDGKSFGSGETYYIYSEIREWVIARLQEADNDSTPASSPE